MATKTLNFKLVLLGDAAVGKSSSVERFVKNEFFEFQQPTIGSLAPMYWRGAAAALIVYDITSHVSFLGAKTWIEELQRQGSSDIVIGLAGNKSDLESKREVARSEAEQYAAENGCIFFETSAKSGDNVQRMFKEIAQRLPKHVQPMAADDITIISPDDQKKEGCCK